MPLTLLKTDRSFRLAPDTPIGRNPNATYVRCHGDIVDKRDLTLGFEFVENGHTFQTSVQRVRYVTIEDGQRFRSRDIWFIKTKHGERPLRPNMPFGEPDSGIIEYRIPKAQCVDLLIVTARS